MADKNSIGYRLTHSLLFWVIMAIISGIVLGMVMPNWFVRIFATFNDLFGKFLGFSVPLIILGLIAPAIAELGKSAGKWVLVTVAIAYASSLFAGFATYFICKGAFPVLLSGEIMQNLVTPENAVTSFLGDSIEIPPVFGVMTSLILAFVVGIGMAVLNTPTLEAAFDEFRVIIMLVISRVIVPLLPVHVFGIFMNMTKSGQIVAVITAMLKVVVLTIILTFALILIQYIISGAIAKKNPFVSIKNMLPAYFTALGTSSSAATIPVTLSCTMKNGVSQDVAGFTVPLCATIHLGGSTVKITAFAMAVMMLTGFDFTFGEMAAFISMLGVTMVAAPGVPGGAITAAQGVLQGILGFTDPMYGLMVALYVAIDSFGTACNVTGDGAIAQIINALTRGKIGDDAEKSEYESGPVEKILG